MKKDWVLVTGAGGFIGGHCARWLHDAGYKVIALQRSPKSIEGLPDDDSDKFRRIIGDLTGPVDCFLPVDTIVHLAAQVVFPQITASQFAQGNILSTLGMFQLASALKVKTVVLHSSTSVYGQPGVGVLDETVAPTEPAAYGASKYMCELIAHDYAQDMQIIIPRTPGIIGPNANPNWITGLAEKAVSGQALKIFNADSPFNNTLHVSDYCGFVQGILDQQSRANGVEIVNLAAREPSAVKKVAEAIVRAAKADAEIVDGGASGQPASIDIGKAVKLFGFLPMTVEKTVATYVREISATLHVAAR